MFRIGDVVQVKDGCSNTHCTVIDCTSSYAVIKSPTGHSYCYDNDRLVLVSPVPERVGNNAGATPASGNNTTNQQKETDFMPAYTRTSADVLNTDKRIGTKVKRSSLQMYDVFSVNGTMYMHTGVRTTPPSSNGTVIYDPETGRQRKVGGRPVLGYTPNGDEIIGYQSVKLNNVTPGEDGATVSFNPEANVTYLGRAEIHLPQ